MSQSFDETLKCDPSNESYTERHFPVMLFCMQFKVVLTFESMDETLECDYSNEIYGEVYVLMMLFIMLYKVIPQFLSLQMKS